MILINESARVMQEQESGLDIIQQWSIDYGMPVSVGKSEAILLSHNNNDKHTQAPVLYIGNGIVENVLGILKLWGKFLVYPAVLLGSFSY